MTVENARQTSTATTGAMPAGSTGFLLADAARRWREAVEGALGPLGIRSRQYGVLATLHEGGPLAQIALAERLRIDRTTMVSLIDGLEALGLVERRVDPADRRAYQIQLTAQGVETVRSAHAAIAAAEETLFGPLGGKEWRRLHGLLRRLCGLDPAQPGDGAGASGGEPIDDAVAPEATTTAVAEKADKDKGEKNRGRKGKRGKR